MPCVVQDSGLLVCTITCIDLCEPYKVPVIIALCVACLIILLLVGVMMLILFPSGTSKSVCLHNPHASYLQLLGNPTLINHPITVVSHGQVTCSSIELT